MGQATAGLLATSVTSSPNSIMFANLADLLYVISITQQLEAKLAMCLDQVQVTQFQREDCQSPTQPAQDIAFQPVQEEEGSPGAAGSAEAGPREEGASSDARATEAKAGPQLKWELSGMPLPRSSGSDDSCIAPLDSPAPLQVCCCMGGDWLPSGHRASLC